MKIKATASNTTKGNIQEVESMDNACRTASNIVKADKTINFVVITQMGE